MKLVRLIYISTQCDDLSAETVKDIMQVAQAQNSKEGITGLLCFNRQYFLQVLEGERQHVSQLYNSIVADPRHTNVTLVFYAEVSERLFNRWSMGFVPESSLTARAILKYSAGTEFRPYEMTGESIQKLMLSLKEALSVS